MVDSEDPFAAFGGHIRSVDSLTQIMGKPSQRVIDKVRPGLDAQSRTFIAEAPFCLIATTGADGRIDISPKGDPAGFVHVLSDTLLAIPDRPGNRRADTFHNLLENDRIGLIFLIPGRSETLRLRGRARLVEDEALRASLAVNGKEPRLVLLVQLDAVFIHCPKCMLRSHLWDSGGVGEEPGDPELIGDEQVERFGALY